METLTNKEKAELTYKAMQKRKAAKKRKSEYEAKDVYIKSIFRCKKLRHDR